MKLQMDMHEATGQGFDSVADFAIEMNPKAFQVLSDTIYKDKIGSIVRELGCNAFDAHVDAGNGDKPFEIHLPDAFEPFFSIRDFGVGISPEDIKTVYTRYFASTKEQSNDVVGAFGLGSKTPFAYTDAFTVISIHKGIKYMYNAHKSNGLPSIVAFGAPEATDEPDGLEVRVSVEAMDYKAFASALKRQLKFFPVKPTVTNGDITWETYTPILEVDGFVYYSVDGYRRPMYGYSNDNVLAGLFIKQGPVAYPIDFDSLNQVLDSKGIKRSSFYEYLRRAVDRDWNKGIIIDMPIGTVEVTASREGISYKDATVENIMKRLEQIARVISREVLVKLEKSYKEGVLAFSQTLEELDGYFKHSLKAEDMEKRFPKFSFADQSHGVTAKFKVPTSVFEGMEVRKYDIVSYQQARAVQTYTLRASLVNPSDQSSGTKKHITIDLNGLAGAKDNDGNENVIYIKDIGNGFVARLKEHNQGGQVFLVDDSVSKAQLESALGDEFTIRNVSELPKVVTSRAGHGGHSITGGRQRLWFKVTTNSIERIFHGDQTCYAAQLPQVFGESFEDEGKGEKFAFFTTFNNKIDKRVGDYTGKADLANLFAQWLQRQGYEIVAIAGSMVNKAKEAGNFECFNELWKEHQDTFKAQSWDMFLDTVLNNYYNKVRQEYGSQGWGGPYSLQTYGKLLTTLGVSEVEPLMDNLNKITSLCKADCKRSVPTALVDIIIADPTRVTDFETLNGCFDSSHNSPATMSKVEQVLAKHGKTVEVLGSELATEFVKLIKEHIVDMVALSATTSALDLTRVEVRDPINVEDTFAFLTGEQTAETLLKKLGVGA